MRAKRVPGPRNCERCLRFLVDPSRACVCRHLIVRENYVDGLPGGLVNVKCPECFRMAAGGTVDGWGVVSFVCSHCGEATGGKLAGAIIPAVIPGREQYKHGRNDGWEGRR
jgi:hypothetical protein